MKICRSDIENAVFIVGIDTGTTQSAMVVCDAKTLRPHTAVKLPNAEIERRLEQIVYDGVSIVGIERLENHGMPIGQSTIETIIEIGRLTHICDQYGAKWDYVMRSQEKMELCFNPRAKDGNIRQALIDIYGGKGTKKSQGWFYGFKADQWQAYAVAHTLKQIAMRGAPLN